MATIIPFLRTSQNIFGPNDISAMSMALDDICKTLNLNDESTARETVAMRIIDLAKAGMRSAPGLRDRVLHEAAMAGRLGLNDESVEIK